MVVAGGDVDGGDDGGSMTCTVYDATFESMVTLVMVMVILVLAVL